MEGNERLSNLKQHISRFMTRRNQSMIFWFTLCAVIASVYAAITDSFPEPVNITLYVFAGMGVNLVYAIFNGAIGIINCSAWCGSLSAYYILLCVMRFLSVSYARKVYDGTVSWGKGIRKKIAV